MKNVAIVGAEDDSLDTDTGVKANFQYVVAVQRDGAGDTIIEADSSNTLEENTPRQNTIVANATFIQRRNGDQVIRVRGKADYTLLNTLVIDGSSNGTPCLRIDGTDTLNRAANAAIDEAGPIGFQSVYLDCATPFRDSSGGVTAAAIQTVFDAGTNTSTAYTNTLTMTYLPGSNESGLTAMDPSAVSSFFDAATFVGAVESNTSTRFEGWTCDSSTIGFGNNSGDCTSLPVYT
jgi:hypothetical protein